MEKLYLESFHILFIDIYLITNINRIGDLIIMEFILDNYEFYALETELFIDDCIGAPAFEADINSDNKTGIKGFFHNLLEKIKSIFAKIANAIKNLILSIKNRLSKYNKNTVAPPKECALEVNKTRQAANIFAQAIQIYSKHTMETTAAANNNYVKINNAAKGNSIDNLDSSTTRVAKNDQISDRLNKLDEELSSVNQKKDNFTNLAMNLRNKHNEDIGKYIDFSQFVSNISNSLKAFGDSCQEHVQFCIQYQNAIKQLNKENEFTKVMSKALTLYLEAAKKSIIAYQMYGALSNKLINI